MFQSSVTKKVAVLLAVVLLLGTVAGCKDARQEVPDDTEQIQEDNGTDTPEKKMIKKLIEAEEKQVEVDAKEFLGLSDCSAVGVDMNRFATEELLEVNEADFDVVVDGAQHGMVADDLKDDSLAFDDALEAVKKANDEGKSVLLKLPSGELDFVEGLNAADRSCAILLSDLKNVCLLGNSTMLTIHGAMVGVRVRNCENLSIKGIDYDYGRTPFSVGKVKSSTDTSVTVVYPDHYPITEDMKFMSYLEYSPKTYLPREKGNFLLDSNIEKYEVDGQTVTFHFNTQINPPVRDILVVTSHYMYGNNAFEVSDSKNLTLEDIHVYATAGMGLVCETTENVYVNRFDVCLKPKTDRLMSSTADGLHFGACRGEIKVTNCLLENTHDDACNVKAGHYYGLSDINKGGNTLRCVKLNYMHRIVEGDTLCVYNKNLELVTELKVVEVMSSDDSGMTIKTEGALSEVTEDMLVANASTAPKVCFENNIVRNKRNRGILLQTRDSVIRNNAFLNVGHGAISVMTEIASFNEAIVPKNIIVENNKVIGCNDMSANIGGDIAVIAYGESYVCEPAGTIRDITIRNNFIANSAKKAMSISSAENTEILNNCIYNPAKNPKSVQNNCAISLSMSENLTINENYIINETATEEYVSLLTDGTVIEEAVAMKDNVGVSFAVAGASAEPDVVKRLPDGVAVNMSAQNLDEFAQVEETIHFVGHTDAYGNEVAPQESSFAIQTFKVAYDDKGIYIGFAVKDDVVAFSSSSVFWEGDGFELYMTPALDENYAFSQIKQTYNDTFQLFVTTEYTHLEASRTSDYLVENKKEAFQTKCWKTDEGYAGKVFINLDVCTELRAAIEKKEAVSCSFVLADTENGATRLQVSNTEHNVENNKGIPVRMGKIRFE